MKPIRFFLFCSSPIQLAAELKGTVRDAETGESLPGANVYIEGSAELLQISMDNLPSPMSAPAATRSS